MITAGYLIWNF